jgi:Holliday junction resolvase RusA-like endonuclease
MPRWQPTAAQLAQWQRAGRVVEDWGPGSVLQPTAALAPGVVAGDARGDPLKTGQNLQLVLTLVLPYPPSLNSLYPTGRDGRRHLSAAGRAYKHAVAEAVRVQTQGMALPLTGRLVVSVRFCPPDHRVRDIMDNPQKCLWDALQAAGVYVNDSQIDEGHVLRGPVRQPACVEVTIAWR